MNLRKALDYVYKLFVILIIVAIIFQPDIERPFFQFIFENTLWIIIALVGAGMFFMLLRNENMIYFNLLCAAGLTFFLRDISSSKLVYVSENNGQKTFKIYQINAAEYAGLSSDILHLISRSRADIISIGEVPPDLNKTLKIRFKEDFPYVTEISSIDFNNRIIFSKYKIIEEDTIFLKGQPQLSLEFSITDRVVQVLFPYILPHEVDLQYQGNKSQLEKLTEEINIRKNEPLIVVGEFNQVYWTKEMREFIYQTRLNNARRFVYAFADRNPYNHVFYSGHINCTYLEDIYDNESNRIGVVAGFELTKEKKNLAYNSKP